MPNLFAITFSLGIFGIWYWWYQFSMRKIGSRSIAWGGGFLICIIASIPLLAVLGQIFDKSDSPKPQAQEKTTKQEPLIPIIDHNYVMQDKMKYGYPAAISEDARKAGQKAEQLVMAMYAGEKNGKHQAHIIDGVTVTALECEAPCKYIKVMSYIDNPYLKGQIKVEHLAANPESIGYLIMQDAMRGKLKPYGLADTKKRYSVWIDEIKGMQRTPMAND